MLFATNYLTTKLAHNKLKYGLFSRVISCHGYWLKIIRIHALNVHCVYGNKRLDDDASLSRYRKGDSIVFSMRWGAVLLKHKKLVPGQCVCEYLAVASKQESCRDSMPSSL